MSRNALFILLFAFVVIGCSKPKLNWVAKENDRYKEYIAAYSGEWLERDEFFEIEFTKPVVGPEWVDKELKEEVCHISPSLKGTYHWKSQSRLVFKPKLENVSTGQEYILSLDLKRYFKDIPAEIQFAGFKFRIAPLSMVVKCGMPRPMAASSNNMQIEISVSLNEKVEIGDLEKLFRFEGPVSEGITTQWNEDEMQEGLYKVFVSNITRMPSPSELIVHWTALNHKAEEHQNVERIKIPAQGSFEVLGMNVLRPGNGVCRFYFSDYLDPQQNLDGLIKVDTVNAIPDLIKDVDFVDVDISSPTFPKEGNLSVMRLIRSSEGKELSDDSQWHYVLEEAKPQVRFVGNGSILPYNENVVMSFEAINLNYIDIEIFKIFTNNVLYDLHFNFSQNSDQYNLIRLGRVIKQQTVQLAELSPGSNKNNWKRYGLDLSKIVKAEAGAMYQLRISFKPSYTDYYCQKGMPQIPEDFYSINQDEQGVTSHWREYAYYDYEAGYDYGSADDPCSLSYYYSDHFASRTFYASNLALSVKLPLEEGYSYAMAYDLQSGEPVSGAKITFYDRQLQVVYEGSTDVDGMLRTSSVSNINYAVGVHNGHFAYLKLEPGKSISQSEFETEGIKKSKGMKLSVYTERGVWRPGDTISLNVIAYNEKPLPEIFPMTLTVTNPRGKIIFKKSINQHLLGLFAFEIPVASNDLTGSYIAKIQAGNYELNKTLWIETVKPNNIRCEWNMGDQLMLKDLSKNISLQASWLHGSKAANLQALIKWKYKRVAPVFEKYREYQFLNPEKAMAQGETELYNGNLDGQGKWQSNNWFSNDENTCGDINGQLVSLITESSGELNTDYFPLKVKMFEEYVGIQIPDGPYGERSLEAGKEQKIKVVVVDQNGQAVQNRKLEAEVFEVNYEWWYEVRSGFESTYQNSSAKKKILKQQVTTNSNGIAFVNLTLEGYNRYFIKVTNSVNHYETGDYFYTGWADGENDRNFVNILSFKPDKPSYLPGETAKLLLPGAPTGQFILHVIRDNSIVFTDKFAAKNGQTEYFLKISKDMAPNVYVDISFVQGLKNKANDLPQRLYGVIPIIVEDLERRLVPEITMKEVIRPDEAFDIKIKEAHGKEMAYQLYLVDEGLLNLTRFKTPQPYNDLMAKEALSLMTWDNFDAVLGNQDVDLEGIISIGGDAALNTKDLDKVKRFKPVVMKSGPHLLKRGETKLHNLKIGNYTGALRVMVIANNLQCGGSSEKFVEVKKELMAQLALPRTLTHKDELEVPVTVFVMDSKIKSIDLSVECTGALKTIRGQLNNQRINKLGDHTFFVPIKATGDIGTSKVTAKVSGAGFHATSELEIVVTNPNPITQKVSSTWVNPGETSNPGLKPYGLSGTRQLVLEVSRLRNVSIAQWAEKLIHYPHGCLEQTISSLFPQCLLGKLISLTQTQQQTVLYHLDAGFQKLRRFQQPSGGFSYWPGTSDVTEWNTTYAGHFMITAKNTGFNIPQDMLEQWYKYQKSSVQNITTEVLKKDAWRQREFAYKLYAMAYYGKPSTSAMNILYQFKEMDLTARALLAAAYCISGKCDIGKKLMPEDNYMVKPYREYSETFGSDYRDEAILVMALATIGHRATAVSILDKLLARMNTSSIYTTQEMSFVLQAIYSIYGEKTNSKIKVELNIGKTKEVVELQGNLFQKKLNADADFGLSIKNLSEAGLSIHYVQAGIEDLTQQQSDQKGLRMTSKWVPSDSKSKKPKPGDKMELWVEIELTNYMERMGNLALTVNFPSTFEVINERLSDLYTLADDIEYQDIRDNQVKTYFALNARKPLRLRFPVHVGFSGNFATPSIICEAMYDPAVYARINTPMVEVRRD